MGPHVGRCSSEHLAVTLARVPRTACMCLADGAGAKRNVGPRLPLVNLLAPADTTPMSVFAIRKDYRLVQTLLFRVSAILPPLLIRQFSLWVTRQNPGQIFTTIATASPPPNVTTTPVKIISCIDSLGPTHLASSPSIGIATHNESHNRKYRNPPVSYAFVSETGGSVGRCSCEHLPGTPPRTTTFQLHQPPF